MGDAASTVYFELDAKSAKLLAELNKAAAAWDRFGKNTGKSAKEAEAAATRYGSRVEAEMAKTSAAARRAADAMGGSFGAIRGGLVALVGALGVREVIEYANTWAQAGKRLTTVSTDAADLAAKQAQLFEIAQRSGEKFGSIVNVYTDLSQALKAAGVDGSKTATVVSALADAAELAGQDFDQVEQVFGRFAKGLTDGTTNTKELRTVLLTVPQAALAVADGLGVSVAELQDMAKAGKLSAGALVNALAEAAPKLAEQAGRVANDFGELGNKINNELTRAIGQNFGATMLGVGNLIVDGLSGVIRTLEQQQGLWNAVGTIGTAAAVSIANAWKGIERGMALIELALTRVRILWEQWVNGANDQTLRERIKEAADTVETLRGRMRMLTLSLGDSAAQFTLGRQLKEAEEELRKLDPARAIAPALSELDKVNAKLETLRQKVLPAPEFAQKLREVQAELGRTRTEADKIRQVDVNVRTVAQDDQLAALEARIRELTAKEYSFTISAKYQAQNQGSDAGVREQIKALEERAGQLRANLKGLNVDLDARQANTELDALRARSDELVKLLSKPVEWTTFEEFKARVAEIAAGIRNIGTASTEAGRGLAALGRTPVDTTAYLTGAATGLAVQKEQEARAASEQNRIVLANERQFSEELIGIIEETARTRVAIAQQQAIAEAKLAGKKFDPETFNAPLRMLQEQERLVTEFTAKIDAKREAVRSGRPEELGADALAEIRKQADARIAADQSVFEAQAQMRVDTNRTVLDLMWQDEQTANARILELATQQGEQLAQIKLKSQGVQFGPDGQPTNPEDALRYEEERQAAILARQQEFQNQWSQIDAQGIARRGALSKLAATLFGKTWADSNKKTLTVMEGFAGAASTIAGTLFAGNKKFAIAQAIVGTIAGATNALRDMPYPANLAAMAQVLATGFAQVAQIKSTNAGGGGGGAVGGVSMAIPTGPNPNTPNLGGFEGGDATKRQAVTVNFNGDMVGWNAQLQENVLGAIRDAVDGKDVVLFNGGSRQAQIIRQG